MSRSRPRLRTLQSEVQHATETRGNLRGTVIITAIPVLAQEPALELQLGGGFLPSRTATCRRCGAWRPVSFSGRALVGLLDAARDDHR